MRPRLPTSTLGLALILAACSAAADSTEATSPRAASTPAAVGSDQGAAPPETETATGSLGRIRSEVGTFTASLTVVNASENLVDLVWIDFDGEEVPWASMPPGSSYEQETVEGHAWRMLDEETGEIVEEAMVEDPELTIELTSPLFDPSLSPVNACRLRDSTGDWGTHLGFPRPQYRLSTTGTIHVTAIFVDFEDKPARTSPEEILGLIFPGAEQAFAAMSYGRLSLTVAPHLVWLRADRPSTGYEWENVEDSAADLPGWGALWFNHEAGHTLGLPDLYDYSHTDVLGFTGGFSLMGDIGGHAPEFLAYERWMLGWVDDEQVACLTTSGETTTLTAVEQPGGMKLATVKIDTTKMVVVESRRPLGLDSKLVESGALVYTVDTSVYSGEGPIVVQAQADGGFDQAPLQVDDSITVDGVTITVVDSTDEADTIEVTFDE